jgi:PAS domain-containing protein
MRRSCGSFAGLSERSARLKPPYRNQKDYGSKKDLPLPNSFLAQLIIEFMFTTIILWQTMLDLNDRQECKAKLNAITKAQAVIEFKLDGTIVTANENFLAAMGYTLAEIEG